MNCFGILSMREKQKLKQVNSGFRSFPPVVLSVSGNISVFMCLYEYMSKS